MASTEKLKGVLATLEGKQIIELNDAQVIDLSNYADGVYLLSLYDTTGSVVKIVKLVKTAN